jgi:energy-converting hydrogenase A subunit M
MQITVTIKDTLIKSTIAEILDTELFQSYDPATLKAAKLPKAGTLVKDIFANEKFQQSLANQLIAEAETAIEDSLYSALAYDVDMPLLADMIEKIEAVTEQAQAAEEELREAEEVKRMVKTLEKAGFKIVKA